jgi:membrane protease YdiL (CAAX protease family)
MVLIPGYFNLEGSKINSLTPPLDTVLLVIASFFPVGFCANVTALIKGRRGFGQSQSLSSNLVGFLIGYSITLVVVALVRPHQVLAFHLPTSGLLFLFTPFVGFACILVEFLAGILLLFLRTGKLVTRVTVHSSYSAVSRIAISDILSILALVIGEELILRQLLYNLLATDFAMTRWIVILLCTVAYAINHLAFGLASVISKLPSGLLYVLLFYLSGLSIGVVILAHATQNLTLLILSRTRNVKNGQSV